MKDRNHRFNQIRRRVRKSKTSSKKRWKDRENRKVQTIKKEKSPDSFLKIIQ